MLRPTTHLHAVIITVLVFLLIGALRLVTFNIHYFDPFNNGIRDYEITDLLSSQLRDEEAIARENRLVLVHVDRPLRTEIAELVDRIARQQPAVIGLDILFEGRRDAPGDSRLAEVLDAYGNIVLAANLYPYDEARGGIPGLRTSDPLFAGKGRPAFTNFLAGTDRTVRFFSPFITTLEGKTETAFAVALAEAYAPDRVARMRHWADGPVRINYTGTEVSFLRKTGAEVLAADERELEIFRDRIVIIGFIHSNEPDATILDRYFTPLNKAYTGRSLPDMYGAVIHANIVSMILDGKYIYELPAWLEVLLVVVFTYVNVLIIHQIYHRLPDTYHGVTRILQLVEFFLFFFLVALAFYHFRLKIDFDIGFLALLLAYDVVMIYESFIRKRVPGLKREDNV